MPFKARHPIGGFKVMYEYANRLADLGYKVHITYPLKTKYMTYRWSYIIRLFFSYLEGFRTDEWFPFNKHIKRSYVKEVSDKYIEDSDIIIATWWSTVLDMGKLSPQKGKKINLIQGYENWEGHEDLLFKSYDLKGLTNVVVARYLLEIVKKYTKNRTELIYNAIDSNVFSLSDKIEDRNPLKICMLYSIQKIKGSEYGIEALNIVHKKYPNLEVELFGVCPEPSNLPSWIKFHKNPNRLNDIYNRNSIFISNSLTEGFGLVSVEAMACGCALICTEIAGHKEYAIDGQTALLVEPENSIQLAEKIEFLIKDDVYRKELAKRGSDSVKIFSWTSAIAKMDKLIIDLINN